MRLDTNKKQTTDYRLSTIDLKPKFYFFIGLLLWSMVYGLWSFSCFAQDVKIKTTQEGGYSFYVDGKPFLIKGVGYNPTPIGKGYDYDLFSDPNKPWLIDGELMKKAGINCIRIYSPGNDLEKTKNFIREMYEKFGIYTVVSSWLGLWEVGANYSDKEFRERHKQKVLNIVSALKDTPGILMWGLGNENNYTFSGKIGFWTSAKIEKIKIPYEKQLKKAEIYYSFISDLTTAIKKIDKSHLVALGNGETSFLQVAAKKCRNIDVLAIIIYRGKSFGNLFTNIKNLFNKPILLYEFGCDSYNAFKKEEDLTSQAEFITAQWNDLYKNVTLSGNKSGNCLGGIVFEWSDEWWKHDEAYRPDWKIHNTEAGWAEGSYYFDSRAPKNLNMNEEWFGIVSVSQEIENGLNKRIPKKAYYALRDFFTNLKTNQ